ncbi:MAG TPA: cell division topological specificity factor MinE [Candidatus Acidoferrales bacterium]|nr:cell division topological specificity factor MinE [Candidatus Acidoferrales bacterium]
MIEWMKRFFGGPTSSTTAKERLRLVLMTDHLALAPEIIADMKRDLIEVISRYVEVDRENVEVNFEQEDRVLAMLANIPITSVNRPAPPPEPPAYAAAPNVASPGAQAATASNGGPPPRRRRRKKPATQSPATAH